MTNQRRGYALIEAGVAIAISTFIMASVVWALHTMQQLERHTGDQAVYATNLHRLSLQLRSDGHQAVGVNESESQGSQVLRLTRADQRVAEYRQAADQLQRVLLRGSEVEHRETYQLPEGSQVSWEIESKAPDQQQLILSIRPGNVGGVEQDQLVDCIEVLLGTDHRRPARGPE